MVVTVTEHPIPEPPKTYDVVFTGLSQDEFVILRAALSDSDSYRRAVTSNHVTHFRHTLDEAFPRAFTVMTKHYDRVLKGAK